MKDGIDYLLIKITEECSEIQKLAMKSQLHGITTANPAKTGALENFVEIIREFSDLNQHIEEFVACLSEEQDRKLESIHWESYREERRQKSLRWLKTMVDRGRFDPDCKHITRLLEELVEQ